jgi:enediyne biosynthesis protein E4
VKVVAGDLTLVDEVRSGRGYQSDYGRRLHFGLANREKFDRVEVRWPSGRTNVVSGPAVNTVLTVTEVE